MPEARSSLTHPLRIDEIAVGDADGRIGVTFCPGKRAPSVIDAPWARDLGLDVDVIANWGAQVVVTLIEDHEFDLLDVRDLGATIRSRGIAWHHLPIRDVDIPDQRFHHGWPALVPDLVRRLRAGGRIVVHCRGGLGRSGLLAAFLVIEFGAAPGEAIDVVRRARPGAIETREQERFVAGYRPQAGAPG